MSYALPKEVKALDMSRAFVIWTGMKARCSCTSNTAYPGYGGSFDSFIKDMGVPEKHESLDRINTFGNYTPSNCRWATDLEQGRNRRDSLKLTYKGKCKTLREWSLETGIKYHTLRWRVLKGWSPEKTLSNIDMRKS